MDVAKFKAAVVSATQQIENAKKEVSAVYKATLVAGEKDPAQLNGLQSIGKANQLCDKAAKTLAKAVEKADDAVAKTTPKPKEEKKKDAPAKK